MRLLDQPAPFIFRSATADAPVYLAAHPQPALEISLVIKGSIDFLVDGRLRTIDAPAAALCVCRESLGIKVEAKRTTEVMWCNARGVRFAAAEWTWLQQIPMVQPITDRLLSLFHNGLRACASDEQTTQHNLFAAQVRDALGIAVFGEYFRQAGAVPVSLPARILRVKRFLDEHYAERCDNRRLAAIADLSPHYLIHLFRQHLGDSPMRYLWKRRVNAGVALLRNTEHGIDEIAHRCGFQSAAHFSRKVKEEYRQSPRELRGG